MEHVIGRLQELLKTFKTAENPASKKFIESDEEALLVLSIWKELPVELQDPLAFGTAPHHKPNLWKYVWKFRRIDFREIEKRTGIEERSKIQEKINLLITHQMIYPDGSISRTGQKLIQSH